MDEDELFAASIYLFNIINHRTPTERTGPGLARLDRRVEEFRQAAEQHWREAAAQPVGGRGVISGFGGGGGTGFDFEGRAQGKMSYQYSLPGTDIKESLRFVAGCEIVIIDRFGMSVEGTELFYEQSVKSSGREVTRKNTFACGPNSRLVRG